MAARTDAQKDANAITASTPTAAEQAAAINYAKPAAAPISDTAWRSEPAKGTVKKPAKEKTLSQQIEEQMALNDKLAADAEALAKTAQEELDTGGDFAPADEQVQKAETALGGAANMTGGMSSAFEQFRERFAALGLADLANSIIDVAQSPDAPLTSEGYYLKLLETPQYKERFGNTNAARIKNGLPALKEGDILKSEGNIRATMRAYGMPAGFYDQPKDLQEFIANDKSAAEVGDILQAYKDVANVMNPEITSQLRDLYGIDAAGIAAHLMDPEKAAPVLEALTRKGTSAAAAAATGVKDIYGASQVAAGMGAGNLSYAKQAQGYATAQQLGQQAGQLANIYGGNYNTAQGMQEAFGGANATTAAAERERLARLQTSSFGGSAGASQQGQSLGIASQQGVS